MSADAQGIRTSELSLRVTLTPPAGMQERLDGRARTVSLRGTSALVIGAALTTVGALSLHGEWGPSELGSGLAVGGSFLALGGVAAIVGAQVHRRRSEMAFGLREPVPWRRTRRLRGVGWALFWTGYVLSTALMLRQFGQSASTGWLVAWGASLTATGAGLGMAVAGHAMKWGARRRLRSGPGMRLVF